MYHRFVALQIVLNLINLDQYVLQGSLVVLFLVLLLHSRSLALHLCLQRRLIGLIGRLVDGSLGCEDLVALGLYLEGAGLGCEHERREGFLEMDGIWRDADTEHDLGPAVESVSEEAGDFGVAEGDVSFGDVELRQHLRPIVEGLLLVLGQHVYAFAQSRDFLVDPLGLLQPRPEGLCLGHPFTPSQIHDLEHSLLVLGLPVLVPPLQHLDLDDGVAARGPFVLRIESIVQ